MKRTEVVLSYKSLQVNVRNAPVWLMLRCPPMLEYVRWTRNLRGLHG